MNAYSLVLEERAGEEMVNMAGGHIYEKKDVGMDVGLPC